MTTDLKLTTQTNFIVDNINQVDERKTAYNSTYPKGGVSCSKDSLVVNRTLVFQIKFSGKNPALQVAAKRYAQLYQQKQLKTNEKNRNYSSNTFNYCYWV